MQHDAWFFVGIFVFVFLIWVATGGPSHPISFAGPYLSPPSPIGSGTYIGLPQAGFGVGSSQVVLSNPQTGLGGLAEGGQTATATTTVDGVQFGPPSPYRDEVTLAHYVSGAGDSNPEDEYVEISVSPSAPGPINISGWTLESAATGNAAVIPQGTEIPTSGIIEPINPITLNPGDEAIITSGVSPIGASFRENECIGYFGQFQTFSPPLPDTCPSAETEMEQYYSNYISDESCVNYTEDLPRCTIGANYPLGLSSSCQSFANEYLNYNGCLDANRNTSGFEGTEWRVYLGRSQSMWRESDDVVKLLDPQGRTVDAFSY